MRTARVFKSGNSQAVRLPKEFRFRGKEVEIFRRGEEVVLKEKTRGLARAYDIIANLELDIKAVERLKSELPQDRDFEPSKPFPKRNKAS